MLDDGVRYNPIPAVAREPVLVDKSEGCHAEVVFLCKTCRIWLGCLREGQRGRVCSEKRGWIASCHGSQQIEELLASSCREAVRRMAHDVGVNVIREVETDREASRICFGSVVGNRRKPGGVGKSQGYRSRIAREVRRASERNSLG